MIFNLFVDLNELCAPVRACVCVHRILSRILSKILSRILSGILGSFFFVVVVSPLINPNDP